MWAQRTVSAISLQGRVIIIIVIRHRYLHIFISLHTVDLAVNCTVTQGFVSQRIAELTFWNSAKRITSLLIMTRQIRSSQRIGIADRQRWAESVRQRMIAFLLPAVAANMVPVVRVVLSQVERFDRCFWTRRSGTGRHFERRRRGSPCCVVDRCAGWIRRRWTVLNPPCWRSILQSWVSGGIMFIQSTARGKVAGTRPVKNILW